MNRSLLSIFFLALITLLYSQTNSDYETSSYLEEYKVFDKIYEDAGRLSLHPAYNASMEAQESRMNRQALDGFSKILPTIERYGNDSLAFYCYFKLGTLYHYFEEFQKAKISYLHSLQKQKKFSGLADSLLFQPYVYSGSIYYSLNQIDSAVYYYSLADKIATAYGQKLDGTNRLYNTLGAIYYETGNYRQAKNYFEKALSVLSPSDPSYKELGINYKINLASTLNKLEIYDQANSIYQEILPLDINRNEILHNIGTINLNLGAVQKAIDYYGQVSYSNDKTIRLYNDLGYAYSNLGKKDSAIVYYQRAVEENRRWNRHQKNSAHGLTLKYIGDEYAEQGNHQQALQYYQQAILQFDRNFNDTSVLNNPETFTGVFSYVSLFNTLVAKADAFNNWYNEKNNIDYLEAAMEAYQSAYRLADHVEKIYDSDEARLFLNRIKYTVHNKPIDAGIQLFELTRDNRYLETVYYFDQQTKASVLALNLEENEILKTTGTELSRQQALLKSSITRLSIKASEARDSLLLRELTASIRDHEIQLGKIQQELNKDKQFQEKRPSRIPNVKDLQQRLDNSTAILSYHLSENNILIILISRGTFQYQLISQPAGFLEQVDSIKNMLHQARPGKRYVGSHIATDLYNQLITPVQPQLSFIKRLVIIPDDELHYLPFEALQNENQDYLIERFSLQYQYSTALLNEDPGLNNSYSVLAFAPFTESSFRDSTGYELPVLPGSLEEVNNLKGRVLTNKKATKKIFLRSASSYPVIHLATHAEVNDKDPLRSFISFYPEKNEYKLFAQEIYDLDLDSTQLVVLSACETGSGQLVRGEGLMSLSRAFAYAGCPNIITSLWKADDKTTAFITRRLYHYLEKGHTKDKALQQAKKDLIHSSSIESRFKTPEYWAHLVLIGEYEQEPASHAWWWIGGTIIVVISIMLILRNRNKPIFSS